jgi:daunorubicin resistance ABC transporter ATP-binding subunit
MEEAIIRTEGLKKSFGKVQAVKGVDLAVEQGTVFGLLGPNGAGKTTTIRILTTLLEPDEGKAVVAGYDVVRDAVLLRPVIGLAGQFAAVDENLTGLENLEMVGRLYHLPAAEARKRAEDVLERFDLADAAHRTAKTYSGGMRRRLDIAAALMPRPPVLFLDEPTTGLDLYSRNELWDMIRELVEEGTTVLLTTQYLEEADRLAQRIAVVDQGRVIANDAPSVLKAQLGNTVAEMGFEDDTGAERARELLARAHPAEREGSIVRLSTNEGPRVLIGVLRELDGAGLSPSTLTVHEPSLDDVFLKLTGRHAESTETTGDEPAPGRRRRRRGAAA